MSDQSAWERLAAGPSGDLVLCHGILGSRRNWRSIGLALRQRRPDLGVILYDWRGHGGHHGAAPPHDLRACAEDLTRASAAWHAPLAVVGHSFGGKVLLQALAERCAPPGLAEAWALDCAPGAADDPAGSTRGALADVHQVLAAVRALPWPLATRDALVSGLRQRGLSEPLVAWMTTNAVRGDDGRLHLRFDPVIADVLLHAYAEADAWAAIETPPAATHVHFVRGIRSERWSAADVARLRAAAAARSIALDELDAGHWLHADAPAAVVALLAHALTSPP